MKPNKPQLKFSRFEFKYLLPNPVRVDLERDLQHFVEFDPFVVNADNHRYFVRSLYFDDPHYTHYFDKVEGVKMRAKFRVRTYTNQNLLQAEKFLETKGRYNQLVFKHREPLTLCKDAEIGQQLAAQVKVNALTEQFSFEYFRRQLRPVGLIDYWRRPYYSKNTPDFRLTFDSDLMVTQSRQLSPKRGDRKRRILPGYSILEIKFKQRIPAWFHRLVQSYQLERESLSKICKGLEALEIVEDI